MWYHDKELKFECQEGCSKCCEVESGEYGHVSFHHTDVERLSVQERKEVIWLGRANTKKHEYWEVPITWNSPCMFLENYAADGDPDINGCNVHNVKPKPCAAYPFWPVVMESEEAWNKEAEFCPGIGKGDVIIDVQERLDSVKDYPNLER